MVPGRAALPVLEVGPRGPRRAEASAPEETAVRVLLNGRRIASLSASPLALEELAVGHLVLAGRVRARADVRAVRMRRWGAERHAWVEARARAARVPAPRLPTGPRVTPAEVAAWMRALQEGAASYREGGGVHTSALAGPEGLAFLAADVGKVNTLDRLAGQALLAGRPTRGLALLTTGRLTGAMAARGLAMGCPLLVSHSGPTTEAVALARARGATLVGYARGRRCNVYTGARRLGLRL